MRLRRLSEYGSVACLVERPTREAQAEQYSDTVQKSGFRKRGRRNGVASDFFPFSPFSFRFFPFLSVSFRFFQFLSVSFLVFFFFVSSIFFCFFPFSSVFSSISKTNETGRHRSRDPFCETPKKTSVQCHAEGGATKGGVSKCEQTQTNADKR